MGVGKTIKSFLGTTEPQIESQSSIRAAITALHEARERIAEFARERASRQLSNGTLSSISRDIQTIEHRLKVYVKD